MTQRTGRFIVAAAALLALVAVGGCGSDEAAEDDAESLGRAKAVTNEAYDDLLNAEEALRSARAFDSDPAAAKAIKSLESARTQVNQAMLHLDAVLFALEDSDDIAVPKVADAENAANDANHDGIAATDAVANVLQAGDSVSTSAQLAIADATEALDEAADTVRSAADAVNDWS